MNKFFGDERLCPPGLAMTETPAGQGCEWCSEKIEIGDSGFIISPGGAYHRACFIRTVIGSVAHIRHTCSCYFEGSSENDPPELTLREAAEAALAEFERMGSETRH
jgi:hypothetical protein